MQRYIYISANKSVLNVIIASIFALAGCEFDSKNPTQPAEENTSLVSKPIPSDEEENVSIYDVGLNWTFKSTSNDTVNFDVYFGTDSHPPLLKPGLADTICPLYDLRPNITYYWKLVVNVKDDSLFASPTWSFTTTSNPVVYSWIKTIGGTGNDAAYCIRARPDGGYIFSGMTENFGNGGSDLWLVAIDYQGNIEWDKTFGTNNDEQIGSEFDLTNDGGYILAGYTKIDNENTETLVVKTDASGIEEWSKSFERKNQKYLNNVKSCDDGGYIILENIESDNDIYNSARLIKLESNGSIEWEKIVPNDSISSELYVMDIIDLYDDYLLLMNLSEGWANAWFMMANSRGEVTWRREIGFLFFTGLKILKTFDGNILTIGYYRTDDQHYSPRAKIIMTNILGDINWTKYLYGTEVGNIGYGVTETFDSEIIATGSTNYDGNYSNLDLFLKKIDSEGNDLWCRTFGGDRFDEGRDVIQTVDGGYLIVGATESYGSGSYDCYIIKTDEFGNVDLSKSKLKENMICAPSSAYNYNE
ncbi:MAG: hypothetical protein P9L92_03680 [Candidatus Electryonea clarkiae]|nr:hypothetical protein [Candidatus Electryonea clarkiae]